jgi:hypothetical protein
VTVFAAAPFSLAWWWFDARAPAFPVLPAFAVLPATARALLPLLLLLLA